MDKKLGFGYMRLPLLDAKDQTSFDSETLNKMVDTFLDRGFTYFDTAYVYHAFQSEVAMRESLVKRHKREDFTIATKLPPRIVKQESDQEEIFNEQLSKLGVDYIDYYLVHNIGVSSYKQACQFDTFGFVSEKKRLGKVKYMGMSFHDTPELLEKVLSEHPELDFVQLQINYIDWDNPNIQSRKCYEIARAHNLPIMVMEPVKGGVLAKVPKKAEEIMNAYAPDASISSWAVRFAASFEGVKVVLSGMSSYEQLLDNTLYMSDFKPLNSEEYKIIDKVVDIINEEKAIACTMCRYCEAGCPENIAIPDYFSLYNSAKRGVSSQYVYYLNIAENRGKAKDCIECGQCEKACPQHLKITDYLKDVSKQFDNSALPARK